MGSAINLTELIGRGGVFTDVEGTTPQEVYQHLSSLLKFPGYICKNEFVDALCQREQVLSTAVGNGIAMPHPQTPMVRDAQEQSVSVCYLKRPIDMDAPDGMRVYVMFVLMTSNVQDHLQVISLLAKTLHRPEVKKCLERRAGLEELLKTISEPTI